MSIKAQLANDVKEAMKAKDSELLATLRLVTAKIQVEEKKNGKEVTDDDVIRIIGKEIKESEDSASYLSEGHIELVKYSNRIAALKKYLPEQLSEEEIVATIKSVIAEKGITSSKQKGVLMGALMPLVKGKADGRLVNKLVEDLLKDLG